MAIKDFQQVLNLTKQICNNIVIQIQIAHAYNAKTKICLLFVRIYVTAYHKNTLMHYKQAKKLITYKQDKLLQKKHFS